MNIGVRYFSRSGNTKKVAEAIGKAVDCPAKSTDTIINEQIDVLFLGGGLYAGNIDKNLTSFAENLTKEKVKQVVVFSTAAGPKSAFNRLKEILDPKGIIVSDKVFQCRGKFLLANKNHPNEQDLNNAATFAKDFIESIS